MAENSLLKEIIIRAKAEGVENSTNALDVLQVAVDAVGASGALATPEVNKLTSALHKMGATSRTSSGDMKGLGTNLKSMVPEFQELHSKVSDMTVELQKQAQIAAAAGSQNPMKDAIKATGFSQEDVKLVERYNEAIGTNATSATKSFTTAQEAASQQTAIYNQYLYDQEQATKSVAGSLPTLRYALYDVSSTLAVAGAALTGFSVLSLKASIDYERAFANVIRTNDNLMSSQYASSRAFEEFVQLASEIPQSFQSLSEIGTLAGQLGVSGDRLQDFVRNVAQFSTVTGESIDVTATAFGRLDALLPDVQGNYEALGSSILNVGINSVATEGQVISITTQLAGIGSQAGLTADELIGLSGALASVGIQPELARGTITRLFGQISRAVTIGGENLQSFATIAGTSADQFASKWSSTPMQAVLDIFRGIRDRGGDAEAALRAVGITSTRDVPAILRLSQTVDSVLVPALSDAAAGFAEGTQLADNYGVIAETMASRLQVLGNNFSSLLASLGQSSSLFKGLVDAANGFLEWAIELQKNPLTAFLSQTAVIITGLVGVLGLLTAAGVRTAAGFIGLRTAIDEARKSNASFATEGAATTTTLFGIELRSKAASVAVRGLGLAFKTFAAAGIATSILSIVDGLHNIGREAAGAVPDVNTLNAALQGISAGSVTEENASAVIQKTAESYEKAFARLESLKSDGDLYLVELGKVTTDLNETVREFEAAWASATSEVAKKELLDLFEELKGAIPDEELDLLTKISKDFVDQTADGIDIGRYNAEIMAQQATEAEALSDAMNQLVDDVFSSVNAQYALFESLSDVGEAFINEGAAVAFTSSEMQRAIKEIVEQSGSAGTAAANLQVLFDYLVQGGYASAAQLTHLQQVIAGLINTAGGKVSKATLTPANFSGFTAGVDRARASLSRAGETASRVRQEVRTLLDYAGDLAKVWNRAFDIRFGGQQTLDTITSTFISLREAADEAAKRIRDLNNDIASLTSDINIQEYFLGIAVEYGDTKRAEVLEAKLAQMRAELADKTADLQKEQGTLNKSLVGNSKNAIENRKTITDLVSQYQRHLQVLAENGASQEQLSQASEQLRRDFIAQATQLGFNSQELQVYAAAFDDVSQAIRLIPRDITVTASVDPAVQAFNELKAASDRASSAVSGLRGNLGSGFSAGPVNTRTLDAVQEMQQALQQMNRFQAMGDESSFTMWQNRYWAAQSRARGYAEGGYTGSGGMYEPAGIVHKGEYVIPKRDVNQATGLPTQDALGRLMNGVRGYATGGYVGPAASSNDTGVVTLSASSLQALAQILPQVLKVNGRVLGETTSESYAQSTAVGSN